MKIFDESGRLIGTVDDNEYIRTRDSIMPIGIKVTIPKLNIPSSGYLIYLLASILSVVAIVITIIENWASGMDYSYVKDGILGMIYMHTEFGIVPLCAVIQLFALLVILRDHPMFRAAVPLWITHLVFVFLYFKNDSSFLFIFGFLIGTAAVVFALWAFTECAGQKSYWFILIALFRTGIFLLPQESLYPIVIFGMFLLYYTAEFIYVWRMFVHAGEGAKK